MKIAKLGAIIALSLVGCRQADPAEQYEIVNRSGDSAAKCSAAKKAADEYLSAGREEEYRSWKAKADRDCLSADLDREAATLGSADNLDALPDNTTKSLP